MNDLFGAESFAESQIREFVQGLVQRLLAYPDLVKQTKVNSKKQFLESQDFQAAVTEAVADNQEAHNTMADYFFTDGPGINAIIVALADAFYEAAIDKGQVGLAQDLEVTRMLELPSQFLRGRLRERRRDNDFRVVLLLQHTARRSDRRARKATAVNWVVRPGVELAAFDSGNECFPLARIEDQRRP